MDPGKLRQETWDLDSDDIASIASDDLHQHRPNRWAGSSSTWRGLTEDERLLWQSLKRLGDQNLAVHLYNAFALKRRGRDLSTAQDVTTQRANGRQAIWAPPKTWTAWPMEERHLPKEELVAREKDDDDEFTYRKEEVKMPSSDLHEELSALVLRMAKNRFRKRMGSVRHHHDDIRDDASTMLGEESRDTSPEPVSKLEHDDGSETPMIDEDDMEESEAPSHSGARSAKRPRSYQPTVSADDDLSYDLLAPPVRHILSQMDKTLQILQVLRANGVGHQSDYSSTDAESESSQKGSPEPKRPRGRPRTAAAEAQPSSRSTTRRGRPKKIRIPLEGESHEDFLVRVARETRRRMPPASRDAAFEEWLRDGDENASQAQSENASEVEMGEGNGEQEEDNVEENKSTGPASEQEEDNVEENKSTGPARRPRNRLRLRDWSDVVGAASLAGFSPNVIARTTRRCADLFGESMVIRRLDEIPASQGNGIQSAEYCPGPIRLSSEDPGSQDSDSDTVSVSSSLHRLRHHRASRQSSLGPSSTPSSPHSRSTSRSRPSQREGPSSTHQSPRSRSTSRSSAGQHFCPVLTCRRAVSGFSRRANLKRHMDLVHGGLSEHALMDQDSGDEVFGGVHVDGFLKTLAPGRGWRGEDLMPRKKGAYWGQKKTREAAAATRELTEDVESDS